MLELDVVTFADVLRIGKEKEQEERLHSQWVTMLPKMSTKELKYVSFNEYVDQCTGRNIDTRTSEEIIAELEELHGMKLV